jgi:hypothetical protein
VIYRVNKQGAATLAAHHTALLILSHCINIVIGYFRAEDDGAYYYTNEDGSGFFFTDDCSNDEFEIRYVSSGAYQGTLRLDIDPATPSAVHQDRKSHGLFYTVLLPIIGGSIVLCAIVLSVVYSRGHCVLLLCRLVSPTVSP